MSFLVVRFFSVGKENRICPYGWPKKVANEGQKYRVHICPLTKLQTNCDIKPSTATQMLHKYLDEVIFHAKVSMCIIAWWLTAAAQCNKISNKPNAIDFPIVQL